MTGFCEECGEECESKVVDNGIGLNEAWGVVKRHVQEDVESDCCGAGVLDEDGYFVTVQTVKEWDESERSYYMD